jgi:parallel beta-helix repeat protein
MHDAPGQFVTFSGPLTIIDHNDIEALNRASMQHLASCHMHAACGECETMKHLHDRKSYCVPLNPRQVMHRAQKRWWDAAVAIVTTVAVTCAARGSGAAGAHSAAQPLQSTVGPTVYYVSPEGSNHADGTTEATAWATVSEAVQRVSAMVAADGPPPAGIEVRILPGLYQYSASTSLRTRNLTGTADRPVVFRGHNVTFDRPAVFDGTVRLDPTALRPVTNATVVAVLNRAAAGHVLQMTVPTSVAALFADPAVPVLQYGAELLTPSTWPNNGALAYVQRVNDPGAVWAEGRTKTPKPTFSMQHPIGANFTIADGVAGQPSGDWAAELAAGFVGGTVSGYFYADWYKETHRVARVRRDNATSPVQVMLEDYSRYGFCESVAPARQPCAGSAPGRFTAAGWLSEVDSAGEYHFDRASNTMYIYPPWDAKVGPTADLGVWGGDTFVHLQGGAFVTVRDLEIRGMAAEGPSGAPTGLGLVVLEGGANNTVGGCNIHSGARAGVALFGGNGNTVIGNDIYDVGVHILSGVCPDETSQCAHAANASTLIPTNNLIANNHLTQYAFTTAYGGARIRGVGDRFTPCTVALNTLERMAQTG